MLTCRRCWKKLLVDANKHFVAAYLQYILWCLCVSCDTCTADAPFNVKLNYAIIMCIHAMNDSLCHQNQ